MYFSWLLERVNGVLPQQRSYLGSTVIIAGGMLSI